MSHLPMTKKQREEFEAEQALQEAIPVVLSNSIPRLEMEIEELQDQRKLYAPKADKSNAGGCGWLLLIFGGIIFLFVTPIVGGFMVVIGLIILASFSGGDGARKKVAFFDAEIKRRREKIVELKEKQT